MSCRGHTSSCSSLRLTGLPLPCSGKLAARRSVLGRAALPPALAVTFRLSSCRLSCAFTRSRFCFFWAANGSSWPCHKHATDSEAGSCMTMQAHRTVRSGRALLPQPAKRVLRQKGGVHPLTMEGRAHEDLVCGSTGMSDAACNAEMSLDAAPTAQAPIK